MNMVSRPVSAEEFWAAAQKEGAPLRLLDSWRQNTGRGEWGPVHGIVLGTSGYAGIRESVAVAGRPAVPLCQGVVAMDGTTWMLRWGRTNHCGQGSEAVLAAAMRRVRTPMPVVNSVDGDRYFYGLWVAHSDDATDRWPSTQVEGLAAVCAALCRAHGWVTGVPPVLGQWEWRRGGRGPAGLDMTALRRKVKLRLMTTPVEPGRKRGRRSVEGASAV